MKLTVVLTILFGTLILACSSADVPSADPTPNVDATVESRVDQERPVNASIKANEKESVADQSTETTEPTPTPIPVAISFTPTPKPKPTATRVRSTWTPVPVITPWPRFKGTCPEVFPDAISIPYKEYFDGLIDGYDGIGDRKTYSYVSPTGSVARNGPFATWYYEMSIAYASAYVPTKFDVYTGHGHPGISWQDYVDYSEVLCDAGNDETLKRRVELALDVLMDHLSWTGHASKWDAFEYIETGANVIDAVSPRGLEHYTKYITGAGVIIVGGSEVPDGAMLQARKSVVYMTSARPEYREILQRNQARISLFGPSGDSSVLPEYPDSNEEGGFAMGMTDASMTANSGWLCYPGNIDRGGDPVIHEIVHSINHVVFEDINEVYFYERIYDLALAAIEKGIFGAPSSMEDQNRAETSDLVGEYWAITVEGYIMDREGFKDSHDTREWIEENDPGLYELITRYFPTEPWPDGKFCPDA
jgi:hypothetical protein